MVAVLLALSGALALPTTAEAQEISLVSNITEPHNGIQNIYPPDFTLGTNQIGERRGAQRFTTGSNPEGYTLKSVVLNLHTGIGTGQVVQVAIHDDGSSGNPGTLLAVLDSPADPLGDNTGTAGNRTFAAPSPLSLNADTEYWVVVSNTTTDNSYFEIALTRSNNETTAHGFSIRNSHLFGTPGSWQEDSNTKLRMEIRGTVEIPPEVTLHLSNDEPFEDTEQATVTATVAPASPEAFTVEISANPVAPATDDDFELSTNRTLSFAANETESTGTVEISPVDDDNPEPDDVVTVSGVVSNAAIPDPDDVTFTIINDDTTAMRNVTVVSGPGPDGVWSAGERVELEVRYNLPVVVEQPSSYYDCWSYYDDGTCRPPGPFVVVVFRSDARPGYGEVLSVALVPYVSGSGTNTLRFAYTVGEAEAGARGVWVVADDGMLLRGATIRPLGGGDVELSEYTLTRVRQVTVERPSGGAWTAGDKVQVTVIFAGRSYTPPKNLDEVYVNDKGGTPSVDLLLGDSEHPGLARTARYKRGSGSNTLTFEYEVTAGDGQVSAVEVVADSLARNGATIRNKRGYDAGLHHLGVPWYSPPPLQVRFVSWPKRHDGRKQVDVRVAFSEPVERSPEEVGEYGVRVGGGEVTSVREVDDRENELEDREVAWEFEIEPDSDELLTVSLEAGRPCEEAGAICTPDGRALSEGIWTMVRGPDEDVELTEPDDETPAPTENVVPPGPEDDETIDTTDTESDFRESPDSEEYLEIPAAGGGCAIASAGHVSGNALRNTVFSLFLTAAALLVSGGGKRYLKP